MSLEGILDFSASINPLGPPEGVREVLRHAETMVGHYPDSSQEPVRRALSRSFNVPTESVWCGNGSTAVMDEVYGVLKPARTIVLEPAFSEYERIASRHESPVVTVPLEVGFALPLKLLGETLRAGDLLILNNPHNPSGTAWPRERFMTCLKEWTADGVTVLIDEAFMDFLPDAERYTALPLVKDGRVIVVRSATKIYALPGLRFGFAVAPPEVAAAVDRIRDPWSVNQIAQESARAAYGDQEFLQRTWHWLQRAQEQTGRMWGSHSAVWVYPTAANYILVALPSSVAVNTLVRQLSDDGILVRHYLYNREPQSTWIRAALRLETDNMRLWQRAKEVLDRFPPTA